SLAERALPLLVNELAARRGELVLVLDDYHLVEEPACHHTVALFLDALPDNVHVVLAARHDPPLRLALARARGQLGELRADDLRLDAREAAELVRRAAGVDLSTDEARALEERTEGWAAGVYLVALALRDAASAADFVRQFDGSNRNVADYLVEDVLAPLPARLRAFLVHTSVLERLSPPLCDALLGRDDSGAVLDELAGEIAFLVPLDGRGRSFRHQRLFGELLRSELARSEPPELVADLHRRAVVACESAGLPDEAARHARAAAGGREAAAVADRHALELARTGRSRTLRRLLAALEPGTAPALAVALSRVLSPNGGVAQRLADADALARFPANLVVATAAAARAFALLLAGHADEAREVAAGVAIDAAEEAPAAVAQAAAVRSLACGRLGRHAEASAWARSAAGVAARFGVRSPLASTAAGAALAWCGDAAAAEPFLEAALAEPEEDEAVRALTMLVLAAARAGRDPDGTRALLVQTHPGPDARLLHTLAGEAEHALAAAARAEPPPTELSDAEGRVLRLLPARLTQREIARELYLSPNTVKTHTRAIYRKLGASTRTEAVRTA
ncbi:MAG TPA: LuxR C-terminal-related transcriptional regulator, partial [Solirubrobacteraceae bacterium]